MRKFCGISEEEHWSVIEHPVKVPFFGLDLGGESLHADFRPIVTVVEKV